MIFLTQRDDHIEWKASEVSYNAFSCIMCALEQDLSAAGGENSAYVKQITWSCSKYQVLILELSIMLRKGEAPQLQLGRAYLKICIIIMMHTNWFDSPFAHFMTPGSAGMLACHFKMKVCMFQSRYKKSIQGFIQGSYATSCEGGQKSQCDRAAWN